MQLICTKNPSITKSFEKLFKPSITPGLTTRHINPNITIDTVYIVILIRRVSIVTDAGIPSFIIRTADAGCPPVADGVIAEKYRLAAEYTSPCLLFFLYLKNAAR